MNRGLFQTQLNKIWEILEEIKIGEERIFEPHFPTNPRSDYKGLKYSEIWNMVFQNQNYNFRLSDDSLLQFRVDSFNPLNAHYVYYEYPYEQKLNFEDFKGQFDLSEEYDEYSLLQDYENYIMPSNKDTVTPIRYDFDLNLYTPCLHPASHIHFGHNSNIRVGAKKILRPLSFLLLIIRQIYPDYWESFLKISNSDELCRNIRDSLEGVHQNYWNPKDEKQIYFV